MGLKIYNTLSRKKEKFVPIDPQNVGVYVCGPTVYNRIHVGNARPFVVFDTLRRLLEKAFPKVTYVRNLTDVDDKIINAARENSESIDALTKRTTAGFHEDIAALNTIAPDIEPKATEHIPQMIKMIQDLIKKGHAYEAEGHVLFNVASMPTYGALSKRSQDDLIAGARVEIAPYKKNPADFVLWKPVKEDEPGWDCPWGVGRPGWHIECSAMSTEYLGAQFDIHAGGLDLIFPHHENEIAQSSCFHGVEKPISYWMHNGYITMSGEKMSKSLGNIFTLYDVLQKYSGEVIRLALLSSHYRQPLDWRQDVLDQAKTILDRFYNALRGVEYDGSEENIPAFTEALEDDLNTPGALAVMHDLLHKMNTADVKDKSRLAKQLVSCGSLLGILQEHPETWFQKGDNAHDLAPSEIESLIQQRTDAKSQKDFARADEIRSQLQDCGVLLEDSAAGTTWKRV